MSGSSNPPQGAPARQDSSTELPWEENGQPSPERFYEMAWLNGKHDIRDVEHWKAKFEAYANAKVAAVLARIEARLDSFENSEYFGDANLIEAGDVKALLQKEIGGKDE